jgi:serine/threonine protein kinase
VPPPPRTGSRPQPPARFPAQVAGERAHTPPQVPLATPALGAKTPFIDPSKVPVSPALRLAAGHVFDGKYRLDGLIGEGGMGAVHRGTQLAINRPVAIKVLKHVPGLPSDQLSERFKREAIATSRLKHPNTVQLIDFGESEGILYLVLELLDGEPLSNLIERAAPLPPGRVAGIGKQIAKSLAEAHELGIVHRDLKPDNVFICQYAGDTDVPKVMDFGIARVMTADVAMTRTGMMIGTPKYMPPEQAMGKKVGPPADLYALGVILFEMLTGKPPFTADSAMALAMAHVHEAPPPLVLPGVAPSLAEAWADLIRALLAKSPDDRPQRASLVVGWLAQLEVEAKRKDEDRSGRPGADNMGARDALASDLGRDRPIRRPAQNPQPRSPRRRRPTQLWLWLGAAMFMALGGLVAWLLTAT